LWGSLMRRCQMGFERKHGDAGLLELCSGTRFLRGKQVFHDLTPQKPLGPTEHARSDHAHPRYHRALVRRCKRARSVSNTPWRTPHFMPHFAHGRALCCALSGNPSVKILDISVSNGGRPIPSLPKECDRLLCSWEVMLLRPGGHELDVATRCERK
jgi:hypothetical protein